MIVFTLARKRPTVGESAVSRQLVSGRASREKSLDPRLTNLFLWFAFARSMSKSRPSRLVSGGGGDGDTAPLGHSTTIGGYLAARSGSLVEKQ